jgi:hypothetical protein
LRASAMHETSGRVSSSSYNLPDGMDVQKDEIGSLPLQEMPTR